MKCAGKVTNKSANAQEILRKFLASKSSKQMQKGSAMTAMRVRGSAKSACESARAAAASCGGLFFSYLCVWIIITSKSRI